MSDFNIDTSLGRDLSSLSDEQRKTYDASITREITGPLILEQLKIRQAQRDEKQRLRNVTKNQQIASMTSEVVNAIQNDFSSEEYEAIVQQNIYSIANMTDEDGVAISDPGTLSTLYDLSQKYKPQSHGDKQYKAFTDDVSATMRTLTMMPNLEDKKELIEDKISRVNQSSLNTDQKQKVTTFYTNIIKQQVDLKNIDYVSTQQRIKQTSIETMGPIIQGLIDEHNGLNAEDQDYNGLLKEINKKLVAEQSRLIDEGLDPLLATQVVSHLENLVSLTPDTKKVISGETLSESMTDLTNVSANVISALLKLSGDKTIVDLMPMIEENYKNLMGDLIDNKDNMLPEDFSAGTKAIQEWYHGHIIRSNDVITALKTQEKERIAEEEANINQINKNLIDQQKVKQRIFNNMNEVTSTDKDDRTTAFGKWGVLYDQVAKNLSNSLALQWNGYRTLLEQGGVDAERAALLLNQLEEEYGRLANVFTTNFQELSDEAGDEEELASGMNTIWGQTLNEWYERRSQDIDPSVASYMKASLLKSEDGVNYGTPNPFGSLSYAIGGKVISVNGSHPSPSSGMVLKYRMKMVEGEETPDFASAVMEGMLAVGSENMSRVTVGSVYSRGQVYYLTPTEDNDNVWRQLDPSSDRDTLLTSAYRRNEEVYYSSFLSKNITGIRKNMLMSTLTASELGQEKIEETLRNFVLPKTYMFEQGRTVTEPSRLVKLLAFNYDNIDDKEMEHVFKIAATLRSLSDITTLAKDDEWKRRYKSRSRRLIEWLSLYLDPDEKDRERRVGRIDTFYKDYVPSPDVTAGIKKEVLDLRESLNK